MPASISKSAFDVLVAQTGLPLDDAQKSMLYAAYPLLEQMIARVTAPMPREAEPALIFVPEMR